MYKIRKIAFKAHPVLGNLELDFTDPSGNVVDTVIFAGENGTGKSTVLQELYETVANNAPHELDLILENENKEIVSLRYFKRKNPPDNVILVTVEDKTVQNFYAPSAEFKQQYPLLGIYSDVDINFKADDIHSVTSLDVDLQGISHKSSQTLPREIHQLFIDLSTLDAEELQNAYLSAKEKGEDTNNLPVKSRMERFKRAFSYMFPNLNFRRIDNQGKHKTILFQKDGIEIPIDRLSSGEKQIIYRGGFLLRDANALKGAFVFIDEPEISMHPAWQQKIMEYYKRIFTDENGVQTSQIFAVTHSPFIIHNENRYNDKVIILARDSSGKIIVKDKPSYYKCTSEDVVEDAFSVSHLNAAPISTVYVEGETDELYFKRAVSVFGYHGLPFEFKWIGYRDKQGKDTNSGAGALNHARHFLLQQQSSIKYGLLYDCDQKKEPKEKERVMVHVMPRYENSKHISAGIENALILDDIDMAPFYTSKPSYGPCGEPKNISEFQKMDFCHHICGLPDEQLKQIFVHLKEQIDRLIPLYK